MNYTTNYHLPQWVKEDRIMMDDFNQMCLDMENGLNKNAAAAAAATAKASADAASAVNKAAADAAAANASTNDLAKQALALAQAAYSPDQSPYEIGSYTGNGNTLTVTLGFPPRFLIIAGIFVGGSSGYGFTTGFMMIGPPGGGDLIISGNQFTVTQSYKNSNGYTIPTEPFLNKEDWPYTFIAFR